MQVIHLLFATCPEGHIVVTTGSRHAHEGLGHEARDVSHLASHLRAYLPVSGEPIARSQSVVEGEVELQLPRRILVIALNHVEPHGLGVFDGLHEGRAQLLELIDVVAIRLGDATVRPAILAAFQPHHLGLGTVAQVQTLVLLLEGVVENAQVAAAIRGQMAAGILPLLTIAKAGAENSGDALVPGKLTEGFRIGNAHQLRGLGSVTDVAAVAVQVQVCRRAIDQLKPALGDAFPMIRGYALADDTPGNRDELIVNVGDAELVDLLAHLPDEIVSSRRTDMGFQIGHFFSSCRRSSASALFQFLPGRFPGCVVAQLQGNGLLDTGCNFPSA